MVIDFPAAATDDRIPPGMFALGYPGEREWRTALMVITVNGQRLFAAQHVSRHMLEDTGPAGMQYVLDGLTGSLAAGIAGRLQPRTERTPAGLSAIWDPGSITSTVWANGKQYGHTACPPSVSIDQVKEMQCSALAQAVMADIEPMVQWFDGRLEFATTDQPGPDLGAVLKITAGGHKGGAK